MRTLAVRHPGKGERLRLRVRMLLINSHLPSAAIKGIAGWKVALPSGQLPGQEVTLVKTC